MKSYTGESRIHRFALRQARPGTDVDVVLCSIRAERSAGGASVVDLMRRISDREVSDDSRVKIETVVASSLGSDAATGSLLRFDLQRAMSSVKFFDVGDVPAIEPPLPTGVLTVHFDSLLDENRAARHNTLVVRNTLFAAAIIP